MFNTAEVSRVYACAGAEVQSHSNTLFKVAPPCTCTCFLTLNYLLVFVGLHNG